MKMKGLLAAFGLAAAFVAAPAAAQLRMPNMSSAYIGAEIGQAEQRFDCEGINCDRKDTAWRIFGGWQAHRAFAVELGYANLGTATFREAGGTGTIETTAFDLSVIAGLPVGPVSIFGRLGGYHAETEGNFPGESLSNDKNGFLFGVGLGYDINRNLGLRAEWKRYLRVGGGAFDEYIDVDMLSIGALWRFQ